MTWITDREGTKWVELPRRKRRNPRRALKFGNVEVGDQLVHAHSLPGDMNPRYNMPVYYLVTDRWFDPVKGEDDPIKGQMVGLAQIDARGIPGSKSATTVRGLASQQYEYADIDYIALCFARVHAMKGETVVGIGRAAAIRRRPKIQGGL